MAKKSRYTDLTSNIQVIAGVYTNPALFDNDEYVFNQEDFTEDFHKVMFGAMYNLHLLGATKFNIQSIEDYLVTRPQAYGTYVAYKGADWLTQAAENVQLSAFDYYYKRMKKMTLLRMYNTIAGMDLKWLYDPDNILDAKKKQAQEEWLDNTSIEEIATLIDKKIDKIKSKYIDDAENDFIQAGDGIYDLLKRLKETPDIGYPFYDVVTSTVFRGARLKKFYLRSAATGVGKSRSMIGDSCYIACDEMYSIEESKWVKIGSPEPTMFVTTEQEEDEIQTMCLAFLSGVNEDHIISQKFHDGEEERVMHAAEVISRCPLFIKKLPDFSMKDIENTVKTGIREYGAKYVIFDYLHSSMKILGEVSSKTGVKGLREDNILFMISIRLKDICNQYGVFIMSATQLNADYTTAQIYDQNLLRGAKAIADKIDGGMIMLQTSQEDEEALKPLLEKNGLPMPTVKMSIYKNRRGRYKDILLWMNADRGTCRFQTLFVTDYAYNLIEMKCIKIKVDDWS